MPDTTAPLTNQQLADLHTLLGDVKPATNSLIASLAESVRDRRTHEHPTSNEDWFCNNLSGWAGDRTAVVLRRLLDAEAELGRVRAELTTARNAALTDAADWLADHGERDAAYLLRTCDITPAAVPSA